MQELVRRVDALWQAIGAHEKPEISVERFVQCYTTPARAYHNLGHVIDCLNVLDTVKRHAEDPALIATAIWFHDAVYEVQNHDNEERSARLAYHVLSNMQVSSRFAGKVADMIMASKHTGEEFFGDTALFTDIDLSILGRSPGQFQLYDQKIREEYEPIYGREAYNAGRKKVLSHFSERSPLFRTPVMQALYETQAKKNLAHTLSQF